MYCLCKFYERSAYSKRIRKCHKHHDGKCYVYSRCNKAFDISYVLPYGCIRHSEHKNSYYIISIRGIYRLCYLYYSVFAVIAAGYYTMKSLIYFVGHKSLIFLINISILNHIIVRRNYHNPSGIHIGKLLDLRIDSVIILSVKISTLTDIG